MSTTRVEAAPAAPTAGVLDGIPPEDLRHLRPVGTRPPLGRYIADVWAHRSFIWALAVSGLRANNGRDKLGNFWLVLSPVVNGLIYFLVFGVMLATGKGVPNFIGFLVIGVFMFTYSNRAIAQGAKAITGNRKLIQTLRFPRAVLPIAEVVEQLLAFGVSFIAMLALVMIGDRAADGVQRRAGDDLRQAHLAGQRLQQHPAVPAAGLAVPVRRVLRGLAVRPPPHPEDDLRVEPGPRVPHDRA
jgi:hypothetical protein